MPSHTATPPPTGTMPSPSPTPSQPPAASVKIGVGSAHPIEIIAYGPWQCAQDYAWDVGHPVLAKPCQSTGSGIKLVGKMSALPGIQADVTLALLDARTGETVSGPTA